MFILTTLFQGGKKARYDLDWMDQCYEVVASNPKCEDFLAR